MMHGSQLVMVKILLAINHSTRNLVYTDDALNASSKTQKEISVISKFVKPVAILKRPGRS